MFFSDMMSQEIPIMENFIKSKIREITGIFFKGYEGYIPRKYDKPYN
jgi:hypothetical protein